MSRIKGLVRLIFLKYQYNKNAPNVLAWYEPEEIIWFP